MSALEFYKTSKREKQYVFRGIAEKKLLKDYVVEKDWWVVQTLDIIFGLDDVAKHLLFKGGTSLSKAWGLISRFSEDIDLALHREYLRFDTDSISKTQVKKLREASFKFVTTTFYETIKKAFEAKGFADIRFSFENLGDSDQDPVSILIYYPTVTQYPNYVSPSVKVELGSRSLKDPFTNCGIVSFVGEQFSNRLFADKPISIPCVNPERTFLEKLFLLHEEFQKPEDKIRVERLSRHLYDITKIYSSEHKSKAYNQELIVSIIKHRKLFNGVKGVNYNSLYPPYLNPIPPSKLINAWEKDYKTMQTNMIPEESPNFEELLEAVKQATAEYNKLKFL